MDPPQNPNVGSLPEYALQVSMGTSDVIEPFVGCRIHPTARVVKHNTTLNSYDIEGVPKHKLSHKWYRQHKVEANEDLGCSLMLQTEVVSTYLSLPIDISQTYPARKNIITIADVPYDALDEILIRLPIPDLCASRLLSRYWNIRIVDEHFVNKVLSDHATKSKICIHDLYSPDDVSILLAN